MPWDYKPAWAIPDDVRGYANKAKRDKWANLPATDHQFYSFHEGVNPNIRVSKVKKDGGGNPVHCTYALVADYDSPQPIEKVLDYAKALPFVPNRIEHTLSGNWRFVWGLDTLIIFPSDKFARHFYKVFPEIAFDPARGMVGFDKPAWEAPERYWTNGCEWTALHDTPIPADVSGGWLVRAGEKFKFNTAEFGINIPLELVKEELAKNFPRFAEWGEFTLGSQGPSFWLDDSTSPKSAIVRETGMQTFSAHAAKGFYRWADLLGIDFVKTYQAKEIGVVTEEIYHDGRDYWRQIPSGKWCHWAIENVKEHLCVTLGVPNKTEEGGKPSRLRVAMQHIQNFQHVDEVVSYVFHPPGILSMNNCRKLNRCQVKAMEPAEGKQEWGPRGNFPFVSEVFDKVIEKEIARLTTLAWGCWGYRGAYALEPTQGQVLFMCGGVGVGKTLINREIWGAIFGGYAEAGAFLSGQDPFNSELFNVGYWAQDDATLTTDPKKLQLYYEMCKRLAANSSLRGNEKFHQACMNLFGGRIGCTCNSDADSIRGIPEVTLSNSDKTIFIRTVDKCPINYPVQKKIREILARELPFSADG